MNEMENGGGVKYIPIGWNQARAMRTAMISSTGTIGMGRRKKLEDI